MRKIQQLCLLFVQAYAGRFRLIIHDQGLILFFLFLPLAYPVLYSLIYNPELVREVKIVVVDKDRTAAGRQLVRHLDATQGVDVAGYAADLTEARRAMNSHKCYGILEIPEGYARNIGRGTGSAAILYCDMSLLLRYRALLVSATDVQMQLGAEIQHQNIDESVPMGYSFAVGDPMPVNAIQAGDTQGGFDSFVMPGVIIFIMHQCIVLAVAMSGGACRERPELYHFNLRRRRHPLLLSMFADVAVTFTVMTIPVVFLVHYVPLIFSFPMAGDFWQIIAYLLPMLIACVFMGESLQALVRQREDVFVVWVATSLLLLFLSGLTWPRFAMSDFWIAIGNAIPATWGMEGFVRMNSNGASLHQVREGYVMLWILCGAYGLLAYVLQRWHIVPAIRRNLLRRDAIMNSKHRAES